MDPTNTPLTSICARWLEAFRTMLRGGRPSEELTPRQEQAAANQEWEDEGGSIKPQAGTKPTRAPGPKIPF